MYFEKLTDDISNDVNTLSSETQRRSILQVDSFHEEQNSDEPRGQEEECAVSNTIITIDENGTPSSIHILEAPTQNILPSFSISFDKSFSIGPNGYYRHRRSL